MTRRPQASPSRRPAGRRLRIVRLANAGTARSDGLVTALRNLGEGYLAAGHEPILIVPGVRASDEMTSQGRVIALPGLRVPRTGGHRMLMARRDLSRLLETLAPDRLEVSDRATLRWVGRWARQNGVPSIMVSHESIAGTLGVWGLPAVIRDRVADRLNLRDAETYDRIVCTTAWAAAEFRRLGVPNLAEVPLGVDLDVFHPRRADPSVRARYARPAETLVVYCGRLAADKRPELAVDTVAALRAGRTPVALAMAGDGPRRAALAYRAARLPVRFAGHIADREDVAALLASADVVLAPGPVETFGLAALEALACGTPVVVDAASALPEVVGEAGVAVRGTAGDFAAAVRGLLSRPRDEVRAAARARAERFGWPRAVAGFLRTHAAVGDSPCAPARLRTAVPTWAGDTWGGQSDAGPWAARTVPPRWSAP